MVTIISGTLTLVQASGIASRAHVEQGGIVVTSNTLSSFEGGSTATTIQSFDGFSNSARMLSASGVEQKGEILSSNPSSTVTNNFIISYNPTFSGVATLFRVIGTSGTVEKFFDRSPFFHTPSEVDVNTLRDLIEVAPFLLYGSTTINSYDYTRHISSQTAIIESAQRLATSGSGHIVTKLPTLSGLPFTLSGSASITVPDNTAPYFDQAIPAAGSSFNSPATQVSFHIKDLSSAVSQGSIYVWVDGLNVVSAGTVVTGTTWPTIQKTIFDIHDTGFVLTRGTAFTPQSTVTVSGTAQDLAAVANPFTGQYRFKIWGLANISGSITGLADADPPVLTPVYPQNGDTDISPDTNISWTVVDAARGVDPTTVKLHINGALKIDGDTNITGGTLARTGDAVSGFSYTYNPTNSFSYGSTITGTLSGADLAGNNTSSSYSFRITSSDTLLISNFFMNSGDTLPLTSGTVISVDVTDTLYGVNSSSSYLTINGQTPIGLTTSVITSGIRFLVPAQPIINFEEDLTVFVQGVNNYPGPFPVTKTAQYLLRTGYGVTWYNRELDNYEKVFPFITNIQVLSDIKNFSKRAATGSVFYRFLTEDQPKADLSASIVSNIQTADLPAVVESDNPFFEYGKTITLEIQATDLEGNQLVFTHTFTIEQRPS